LIPNNTGDEVNGGSKEQEDGKTKRKKTKRKKINLAQNLTSHSPDLQNSRPQKQCSHKSHQGEDASLCDGKAKSS
jgi:hypothetical protein